MGKFVEIFRSKGEETAATAASHLSNIDAAQEERVSQQESAKKSTPPKISQGETSSKTRCRKTNQQTPPMKRKIFLVLILPSYDVALMISLVFFCPLQKKRLMKVSCIGQLSNVYHHSYELKLKQFN